MTDQNTPKEPLSTFFEAARLQTEDKPLPSEAFMAQIMEDAVHAADNHYHRESGRFAQQAQPKRLLASLFQMIGGSAGFGGLIAAGISGLMIGFGAVPALDSGMLSLMGEDEALYFSTMEAGMDEELAIGSLIEEAENG